MLNEHFLQTLRAKIATLKSEYRSLQSIPHNRYGLPECTIRRRAMLHEQLYVLVRLYRHLHAILQNLENNNQKKAFIWMRLYSGEIENIRQKIIMGLHYPITMGDPLIRWPDIATMAFPQFNCTWVKTPDPGPFVPIEIFNQALERASTQKKTTAKLKKALMESLSEEQIQWMQELMKINNTQSIQIQRHELFLKKI